MADWAKGEAVKHHLACDEGRDQPSLGYKLAKKLVLSKVIHWIYIDISTVN